MISTESSQINLRKSQKSHIAHHSSKAGGHLYLDYSVMKVDLKG